eukprot:scaffold260020_cov38-Prasinocladus_malaysianus.AAC.1
MIGCSCRQCAFCPSRGRAASELLAWGRQGHRVRPLCDAYPVGGVSRQQRHKRGHALLGRAGDPSLPS